MKQITPSTTKTHHNMLTRVNQLRQKLRNQQKHNKDTGFSLIEMTVALTIIMIITAISVIAFGNHRKANIDSSVQTDVRSAVVKIETWKTLNPRGTPSEANLVGFTPSQTQTIITITPLGNREYEIRGCNPKGKATITDATGNCTVGYVYNSINDKI